MAECVSVFMGRRKRFLPKGGDLVEATCRTIQGRHLLRPSPELNQLVVGVLARAQAMYPVQIHAFVVMSNHYHLLLSVPSSRRLSQFMNFFQSNVAREAGRLHNWRARFWSGRFKPMVVSWEEGAQIERLTYILSHGVKESLVARSQDWPGVHSVNALRNGTCLEGVWIDRTRRYAARTSGEKLAPESYATAESVSLEPIPCWAHMEKAAYRRHIRDLLSTIAKIYRAESRRASARKGNLPCNPHYRPRKLKKSYAPWCHCASRAARRELQEAYAWFLAAYQEASERLRRGDPSAKFPSGSFPPPMPFVA